MIIDERKSRDEALMEAARAIMTAGRTAPKGKGVDLIEILTLSGKSLGDLSGALREESERTGMKFFLRDADNVDEAGAVILLGTRSQVQGLNCAYCGFATCAEKETHPGVPCAINTTDVGIALGSMVSKAADLRIDTRIMFSAGFAARRIGLLTECQSVFAIPLSISSKSPFFDRKPKQ